MQQQSAINLNFARARVIGILLVLSPLLALPALAQQSYVGRWDVYGGFTSMMQPSINLNEPGFNLQAGMRAKTWLTLGFDYSVGAGRTTLEPGMLIPSLQNQLGAQLGHLTALGLVPPGYNLAVPVNTRTQSFQVGPDFPIRKFESVTFFVRPALGAMQIVATPRPADPIATAIIAQLTPSGKKTDWTYFYGFGGGLEFNVNHHFALRFQADYAHDQMFNDILKEGNTIRFSVGPAFQWGKNVAGR
ncbi:MAG TPA: outer membrane beta-barrel protein [Bryobacteraceae bacterium]|nr:outer membrane beta-barrel protein [Bryobacteraceae bacterium]